ncbi:hypothetical protein Syun_017945 [Stephania yunnanensis]|uniref:Uncharacterized protein n=1 Tax=Stephania yunnanensis TaxID=152371 RepID=A0AAP0IRD3_9MAGN
MAAYYSPSSSLVFNVTRKEPELIVPAEPTPHEFKQLSDIDGQESFRFHHWSCTTLWPRVEKKASSKPSVECTGEGLLFIEAEADVRLDRFDDADLLPPFPCLDRLLYDEVPGQSHVILNFPILIQVTRLKCGGFIVTTNVNHTMLDGVGVFQFLRTVGEFARGATQPSIPPVWERHLLNARHPPRVTHTHLEYTQIPNDYFPPLSTLIQRSYFFRRNELSALRRQLPPDLAHRCSTFNVLTALLWICRTIALSPDPEEEVRVIILVNIRTRLYPALPLGYYGNGLVYPAAVTTARELMTTESAAAALEHAVEKVRRANAEVTDAYVKSVVDLMEVKEGRPVFPLKGSLVVSDLTKLGGEEVDYGWGKAVYAGVARGGTADVGVVTFYMRFKNREGEEGVVVPMAFPSQEAMIKFEKELIRRGLDGSVTQLKCGGFIVTSNVNHTMFDGLGMFQFLRTVGEFARGATQPSIAPVWERHLLNARHPPLVTHTHLEYTQIPNDYFPPLSTLIQRSYFFRRNELSALRRQLPPDLAHRCSTFDVITALL